MGVAEWSQAPHNGLVLGVPESRVTRQDRYIYVAGRAPTFADELHDVRAVVGLLADEPGVVIAEFINDDQTWERARGFFWYRGLHRTPPLAIIVVGCENEVFRMGIASLSAAREYPIYFSDDLEQAKRIAARFAA